MAALGSFADWVGELDRRVLGVLGAMVAAFLLMSAVQGRPPADTSLRSEVVAVAPVDAQLGEYTVVAQPGDTYWAIASSLIQGADVRPIVEQLVARNGGADLMAGQQVIIPGDLH
ncbi:MAG: LysM peptidoglycan-binding domain-containing protein [Acidimicrobiales bacterium]